MLLRQLRKKSILLISEKLSSSQQVSDSRLLQKYLYFFNLQTLFSAFLSLNIVKKMHKDFTHFVNTLIEI